MLILPFDICNYNTVVLTLYVFFFLKRSITPSSSTRNKRPVRPTPFVFTLRLLLALDSQTLPRSSTLDLLARDLLPLYALKQSTPLLIHC